MSDAAQLRETFLRATGEVDTTAVFPARFAQWELHRLLRVGAIARVRRGVYRVTNADRIVPARRPSISPWAINGATRMDAVRRIVRMQSADGEIPRLVGCGVQLHRLSKTGEVVRVAHGIYKRGTTP